LYTYSHPRPSVAVDVAIIRPIQDDYQILLIQRAQEPFRYMYALPGGFVGMEESLEEAAQRELFEETGVKIQDLIQVHTFSDPSRDPRGRVISTCFGGVLETNIEIELKAGDDAARAEWFNLVDLPPLAFDHQNVIQTVIDKLLPEV
jgi:8-oxo-dGTP diphosphatase